MGGGAAALDSDEPMIGGESAAALGALQSPTPLEWLTDNGSNYSETREFVTALNLIACFRPIRRPESNGISEGFVNTFKRDYVRLNPLPDAVTALEKQPSDCPLPVGPERKASAGRRGSAGRPCRKMGAPSALATTYSSQRRAGAVRQ